MAHNAAMGCTRLFICCCLAMVAAQSPLHAAVERDALEDPVLAAARLANEVYQRRLVQLIQDLDSEREAVRLEAIALLGRSLDQRVIPYIRPFLDPDFSSAEELQVALHALMRLRDEESRDRIRVLTGSDNPDVRATALFVLDRLDLAAPGDFLRRIDDNQTPLRISAAANLAKLEYDDAAAELVHAMRHDSDPVVRRFATIAVGKFRDERYAQDLIDGLTDPDAQVRRYAARGLVLLDHVAAVPYLLLALEQNVAPSAMHAALVALTGHDFGFDPHGTALHRQRVVDEGIIWWGSNAESLQR